MSGKNTAVFGLYPDEKELVEGIEQLKGPVLNGRSVDSAPRESGLEGHWPRETYEGSRRVPLLAELSGLLLVARWVGLPLWG